MVKKSVCLKPLVFLYQHLKFIIESRSHNIIKAYDILKALFPYLILKLISNKYYRIRLIIYTCDHFCHFCFVLLRTEMFDPAYLYITRCIHYLEIPSGLALHFSVKSFYLIIKLQNLL